MACLSLTAADGDRVGLVRDEAKGRLQITIDGREALVYCYDSKVDLPHYLLRSPSGKPITAQYPDFLPHHRSVWFADTVELRGGAKAEFYKAMYSRVNPKNASSPLRNRIRHVEFLKQEATGDRAMVEMALRWEAEQGKSPILDEHRTLRVVPLGQGEYLLDLMFELRAAYGDVAFLSDRAHYAWPYVRMHSKFSGQHGGTIVNSEGGLHEKDTHDKPAHWVDYSNAVDGLAEGAAILDAPGAEYPHRWLTREYGVFGPRRVEVRNGKPFTLAQDNVLRQRVGILVHSGDAAAGRVAERYRQFAEGKL